MQLHTLTATLLTTGQHIAHISQSSLPSLTHLIDTPTSQMLDFSVAPPSTPKTTRVLLFWSAGGASLRQDVWREREGGSCAKQASSSGYDPTPTSTHTPPQAHSVDLPEGVGEGGVTTTQPTSRQTLTPFTQL